MQIASVPFFTLGGVANVWFGYNFIPYYLPTRGYDRYLESYVQKRLICVNDAFVALLCACLACNAMRCRVYAALSPSHPLACSRAPLSPKIPTPHRTIPHPPKHLTDPAIAHAIAYRPSIYTLTAGGNAYLVGGVSDTEAPLLGERIEYMYM